MKFKRVSQAIALISLTARSEIATADPALPSTPRHPPAGKAFWSVGVGPYYPELDPARRSRFEQTFDDHPRPLFRLELDYAVTELGPGQVVFDLGLAYARFSRQVERVDASGKPVHDEKGNLQYDEGSFNVLPLSFGAGFIADKLAEGSAVPLVAFAKGGVVHAYGWKSGDAKVTRSAGVPSQGSAIGAFRSIGLALLACDPATRFELYDQTGISQVYFYLEWLSYELSWFQSPNLSDQSWVVGMMLRN